MTTPSIVARWKDGPVRMRRVRFRGKILDRVSFPDDGKLRRIRNDDDSRKRR